LVVLQVLGKCMVKLSTTAGGISPVLKTRTPASCPFYGLPIIQTAVWPPPFKALGKISFLRKPIARLASPANDKYTPRENKPRAAYRPPAVGKRYFRVNTGSAMLCCESEFASPLINRTPTAHPPSYAPVSVNPSSTESAVSLGSKIATLVLSGSSGASDSRIVVHSGAEALRTVIALPLKVIGLVISYSRTETSISSTTSAVSIASWIVAYYAGTPSVPV